MENIDIITIAKDENNTLIEWIEHYIQLNINHIYIFDDNSEINFEQTIRSTNKKILNKVTIFTIKNNFYTEDFKNSIYYDSDFYKNENISKQMYLINYFVNNLYNNKKWLLHCDVDEFLILKNKNFLKDIINNNKECNKIFIPWIIYGTS